MGLWRRPALVAGFAAVLVGGTLAVPEVVSAAPRVPGLPGVESVPTGSVPARAPTRSPSDSSWTPPEPVWPVAGSAVVQVPAAVAPSAAGAAAAPAGAGSGRPGGLPV